MSGGEGKPTSRARGRELALWLMCHLERRGEGSRAALELFWTERPEFEVDDDFLGVAGPQMRDIIEDSSARRWARRLTEAYLEDAAAVDQAIGAASERWRIERMDRVDRNVLRLAAVELRTQKTPRNVVVAEAVRLAARYGSERSAAFVNALAEALARALRDRAKADAPG
ncbi:hypothetical protein PPSIR1_08951 [Plesiocystis pacifica SIR-1]|uniref:Transcription antitermination protein NusB n=1 Tax=Plesiocystis pacifica SIR-1 TaxID=391625 RepID=A6G719_9BACT|nr:transcription antitermination factor NusB [Plesiocystis pacifica]EDM78295.1 hypothetical protein PPSIR1_08951 [Plesiocystis pacifica SIR-1]